MLHSIWQTLPTRFPSILLDASIIMPNHFHGIIVFPATNQFVKGDASAVGAPLVGASLDSPTTDNVGVEQKVPTRGTPTDRPALGTVVGAWKSLTTVGYVAGVKTQAWKPFAGRLWQRNYYEHVVRDDDDLARIRYYIVTNPRYWSQDAENPQLVS